MKTFYLLILIFFILMMIKLSFQLEFILIRLKKFHLGKNSFDKNAYKTLKSIDRHLEAISIKMGAEESKQAIESQKEEGSSSEDAPK